ncbi:MAG: hypothetical protein HY673_23420 [Chloroflexi bacterium]|nr:hypothetical protein [Chloroflexota bacterium]
MLFAGEHGLLRDDRKASLLATVITESFAGHIVAQGDPDYSRRFHQYRKEKGNGH